jgi:hypothetical protein
VLQLCLRLFSYFHFTLFVVAFLFTLAGSALRNSLLSYLAPKFLAILVDSFITYLWDLFIILSLSFLISSGDRESRIQCATFMEMVSERRLAFQKVVIIQTLLPESLSERTHLPFFQFLLLSFSLCYFLFFPLGVAASVLQF